METQKNKKKTNARKRRKKLTKIRGKNPNRWGYQIYSKTNFRTPLTWFATWTLNTNSTNESIGRHIKVKGWELIPNTKVERCTQKWLKFQFGVLAYKADYEDSTRILWNRQNNIKNQCIWETESLPKLFKQRGYISSRSNKKSSHPNSESRQARSYLLKNRSIVGS